MKTLGVEIKPSSGFGTSLKGDTLFGQIMSVAFEDEELLGVAPASLIDRYLESPAFVFSSAFPMTNVNGKRYFYLPKPSMPGRLLFPNDDDETAVRERKERKKLIWAKICETGRTGNIFELLSDDVFNENRIQYHNTINRATGTTGIAPFTPFSTNRLVYKPGVSLVIFAVIDTDMIDADKVISALKRIGRIGFGSDASIGAGRYELVDTFDVDLFNIGHINANACWTLGPAVVKKEEFSEYFYQPFVRFGRHGGNAARSGRPFKNPVIMAAEGAVFVSLSMETFKKPFVGSAVTGVSKAILTAVTQGYAPYIPIRIEV